MDITRTNFREQLPHLQDVIDRAQFFAIDTEFTGLFQHGTNSAFDTPAEYYEKIQQNTDGYIIVQFGITAFFVDDGTLKDIHSAGDSTTNASAPFGYESFNFYIYPRSAAQSFRCQGEAVSFLGSHNFDFNKLFQDGLSFCNLIEANEKRQKLDESHANATKIRDPIEVPKEDEDYFQQIRQQILDLCNSNEDEMTEIVIEHCNSFRRCLLYNMIEHDFPNEVFASSRKIPNSSIKNLVIQRKRGTTEEEKYWEEKRLKERDDLENQIGFTLFLKMLSDSKKLIIGHNMLLDVMYSMRQFIAPASKTLADFKRVTHKMFPALLDTKYMCTQDCLKAVIPSSILGDIYEIVSKKPFKIPKIKSVENGFSYESVNGQIHNAAYDSYMTGVVFIALATHLKIEPKNLHGRASQMKHFMNKMFVTRLADICFIDLTGKEPKPKRDHVFHVTVPDNWKHSNIINQFRQYGSVYSSWLSPNEAFVSLHNREHARGVISSIQLFDGVTIMKFDDYQSAKAGKNGAADSQPETCDASRFPAKRRSNENNVDDRVPNKAADSDAGGGERDTALDTNATTNIAWTTVGKKRKQEAFAANDDWAEI